MTQRKSRTPGQVLSQPYIIGTPTPRDPARKASPLKPRKLRKVPGRVVGPPVPHYGKAERVKEAQS